MEPFYSGSLGTQGRDEFLVYRFDRHQSKMFVLEVEGIDITKRSGKISSRW